MFKYFYLILPVLSSLCRLLDRNEVLAGTLWLCSTTTRNVPDVVRRGWESIPVLRNLIARYVRRLRLLKYNNWPPRPTGPGKNVESRRNLKFPVTRPPLCWILQRSLCWDGLALTSRLLSNIHTRRRNVLMDLLNPEDTAVNLLLMISNL